MSMFKRLLYESNKRGINKGMNRGTITKYSIWLYCLTGTPIKLNRWFPYKNNRWGFLVKIKRGIPKKK